MLKELDGIHILKFKDIKEIYREYRDLIRNSHKEKVKMIAVDIKDINNYITYFQYHTLKMS